MIGEAEEDPGSATRAGVGGGLDDGGYFRICEAGNDWCDVDIDRDARGGELLNGTNASGRSGGAGFERAGKLGIESDDGDGDGAGMFLSECGPEIDIAEDEGTLGHGGDGLMTFGKDFEALSGDLKFVLDGLIDVCDGGHDDGFGLPAAGGEFAAEERCGIGLRDELGLEIEAAREAEVFVVWACEAIDASVFTAAVWVEGPIEWDIGSRDDAVDDGLGAIAVDAAFDAAEFAGIVFALDEITVDFLTQDVETDVFEAIGRIQASPAAVGRAAHEGVLVLMIGMWRFVGHTDHYANI